MCLLFNLKLILEKDTQYTIHPCIDNTINSTYKTEKKKLYLAELSPEITSTKLCPASLNISKNKPRLMFLFQIHWPPCIDKSWLN